VNQQDPLHRCLVCSSEFVHLVETRPIAAEGLSALLRCPNCGVHRAGVFSRRALAALEKRRQVGEDELRLQVRRLELTARVDEIGDFAAALDADAILPEDF
jgi:DNA-directed RNA polymerase subunit RPC12/RpoP